MRFNTILTALLIIIIVGCGSKGSPELTGSITPPVTPPAIPKDTTTVDECEQCIILAEQWKDRIAIVNVKSGQIIWEWRPAESNISAAHLGWFGLIDEAKPVYNRKYILLTATHGAVALIRIKDKKMMFYAYAGGQPHSAELLPDGNIVCASSVGNTLTLFQVDSITAPEQVKRNTLYLEMGHNVVWDLKNQLLWSAGGTQLIAYKYNFNCTDPILTPKETIAIPAGEMAHDLSPIYNQNALWLTNINHVYRFDINTRELTLANDVVQDNIKSISSGPSGFPTIISQAKTSYWTDEIKTATGARIFQMDNLKIYKARWFINNLFSYPLNDSYKECHAGSG